MAFSAGSQYNFFKSVCLTDEGYLKVALDASQITAFTEDTFVTGMTFNEGTYDLTLFRNQGEPPITQNLGILASDVNVTGGTYNPVDGSATFCTNSGTCFTVTGFLEIDAFWSAGTGTNAIVAKEFGPTSSAGDFSVNAGLQSSTAGFASAVLGGQGNLADGALSAIIAGAGNDIDSDSGFSLILIGEENLISGGTNGLIGASAESEIKGGESNVILASRISEMKGEYSLLTGEANTIESSARGSAILGGFNSTLAANYALIFGGSNHEITSNSTGSAVLGGGVNKIDGTSSVVIGGLSNSVSGNSNSSVVIAGSNNKVLTSIGGILGGVFNTIQSEAQNTTILGGVLNNINTGAANSSIVGGNNQTLNGPDSAIVAGNNNLNNDRNSAILGGRNHEIANNSGGTVDGNNAIVAGVSNAIGVTSAGGSAIVGGNSNDLTANNSVILGGNNINGTDDNTAYVPYLNVMSADTASSNYSLLVRDDSTGRVETVSLTGSGTTALYQFGNGLQLTGNTVEFGDIIKDTVLDTNGERLKWQTALSNGTHTSEFGQADSGFFTYTFQTGGTFANESFITTNSDGVNLSAYDFPANRRSLLTLEEDRMLAVGGDYFFSNIQSRFELGYDAALFGRVNVGANTGSELQSFDDSRLRLISSDSNLTSNSVELTLDKSNNRIDVESNLGTFNGVTYNTGSTVTYLPNTLAPKSLVDEAAKYEINVGRNGSVALGAYLRNDTNTVMLNGAGTDKRGQIVPFDGELIQARIAGVADTAFYQYTLFVWDGTTVTSYNSGTIASSREPQIVDFGGSVTVNANDVLMVQLTQAIGGSGVNNPAVTFEFSKDI